MNKTTRVLLWLTGWIVVLFVVLGLVAQCAVESSRRKLVSYCEGLEKRGESLKIEALAPPDPPKNDAPILIEAMKELRVAVDQNKVKFIFTGTETAPGRNLVVHLRDKARTSDSKESSWEEAAQQYAPLEEPLAKIRQLAKSPSLEIQPDYELGFDMPLDGLTESLKATQFLSSQCTLRLHAGDLAGCLDNILTMLALAEFTGKQKILISQLVSTAIIGIAQVQTWELLQSPLVSDEQLQALQGAWEKIHITKNIAPLLRMERACAVPTFELAALDLHSTMRSMTGAPAVKASMPTSWEEFTSMGRFFLWHAFFRHTDELHLIEDYQLLIDAVPRETLHGPWNSFVSVAKTLSSSTSDQPLSRLFSRMIFVNVVNSLHRLVSSQAMSDLCVTAIAIKRYQLAKGSLPESLARLVPAYLPTVPIDLFDGKPLRYRASNETDYLLYSMGADMTDDGGDATRTGIRKGLLYGKDIVWPMPAAEPPH